MSHENNENTVDTRIEEKESVHLGEWLENDAIEFFPFYPTHSLHHSITDTL